MKRFQVGNRYIGVSSVGSNDFTVLRRTEKTIWVTDFEGVERRCKITVCGFIETAIVDSWGLSADTLNSDMSAAETSNLMEKPMQDVIDLASSLGNDIEKRITKLKKKLDYVNSRLEKNRTSTMMDGWQTQKFARKSRNWDYYAKIKNKLRHEIYELQNETK
jgi:exonuclease VII large subunit